MTSTDFGLNANDLIGDQVSNIVWVVLALVGVAVLGWARTLSTRIRWLATSLTMRLIALQIFVFALVCLSLKFISFHYSLLLLLVALIAIPFWMIRSFRAMGISSAFSKTSSGVSFDTSLQLARREFAFLGIGAHKLVNANSFKDAMERCATNGRTARFLLSDPNNPSLERMAKRNDIDPSVYKKRVKESINKLIDLRSEKSLNISIRVYKNDLDADYQRFRLVFIDREFCLLGWTVWGAHEGKDNPQLILKNRPKSQLSNQTVYKAFEDYFEALWDASQEVQKKV